MQRYRAFERSGVFGYLEDGDRLLTAAPDPVFRAGVIGCGMMGQEHLHNLALVGAGSVAGLYDPADRSVQHAVERLRASGNSADPVRYRSLDEAAADPNTDVLIIATPNDTHLEVLRAVAGCGKALFVEKPLAASVADALEAYRLLQAHDAYVQVGLQYRFKAVYREAIDEVFLRRSTGPVHSVHLLEHRFPFLDKVGQWNKFSDRTGGTLVEKCCHYFDLLNLFAQAVPERVFATGSQSVNFRGFERDGRAADGLDRAEVIIEYAGGVTGQFSVNMFTHGLIEALTVCGEHGRLHAAESSRLGEANSNTVTVWASDHGLSRTSHPSYPKLIAQAGHHGSTFHEHCALADGLRGSVNARLATPLDALWSIIVAAAAQRSIETGAPVEVASLLPEPVEPRRTELDLSGAVHA